VRLAVVMRRPLTEVFAWPDEHVQLLMAYMHKSPPAEERIELAVADLMALNFNINRSPSTPARSGLDFLRFQNPWKAQAAPDNALSPLELKLKGRLRGSSNT
jgi:hypothetical protein